MNHPFYQQSNVPFGVPAMPHNTQNNFFQKLGEFSQMIQGNPEQIARNLLSSGQMSQAQFNQYAQIANQILGRH